VSVSNDGSRSDAGHEPIATLVRWVPVRLVEVSRGGCRLECEIRLAAGVSGQLMVELQGIVRIDDVRVARCQQRVGASAVYQVGAELLRTRRLGRRSVRMAVRKIISEHAKGVSHARGTTPEPAPLETSASETGGQSRGRAPPAEPERGS